MKVKQKTISKETASLCYRKGIKVYPIYELKNWYIQVDIRGKLKTYKKQLHKTEVNNAIIYTMEYFAKNIEENSFN